jgi:hypothetical protein
MFVPREADEFDEELFAQADPEMGVQVEDPADHPFM